MDIGFYATDKDLENNGAWVDIGQGASIKVARIGNPEYDRLMRFKTKPHRKQIQKDSFPAEKLDAIIEEVVAECILLDWEGIEQNGKKVKYTKAKALEFLRNYRDFKEDVMEAASYMETFKAEEVEEDQKN